MPYMYMLWPWRGRSVAFSLAFVTVMLSLLAGVKYAVIIKCLIDKATLAVRLPGCLKLYTLRTAQ